MAWWSKALDIISSPLSQPATFFTKGPGAAAAKVKASRKSIKAGKSSGFKVIGTTLASTALAAGAILAISGASAGAAGIASRRFVTSVIPKAAKKTAKFIVPKTVKGKIYGGTASLIGLGILKDSPKARGAVVKTVKSLPSKPGKIVNFGGTIADVIEGKTVFTKENVVKGAKAAGVVGLVAGGAALIIPKFKGKGYQEAPILPVTTVISPEVPAATQLIKEDPIGIPGTPQPAQTVAVRPTTTRKKRSKKKAATPSMRQSVKINIGGRYLKQNNYGVRC